MTPFVCNTAYQ